MNNQELLYKKVGKYLTDYIKDIRPHIIEVILEEDGPINNYWTPMNLICYMDPDLYGVLENRDFHLVDRFDLKRITKNIFNIEVFEVYRKFMLK
jgi:hypothetical protein